MPKIMLVNQTHVEESRVAVLDDGVLDAYEIETINRTHVKGNIYNAVVETAHAGLDAAFLKLSPEMKGFLPLDEVNFKLLPARGDGKKGPGKIGQHLHSGQRIMAQVVREPFAGKPPTVSTYFSLPGRYLVLMPGVDSAGVSRKIDDDEQRERLKKIVSELAPPEGFGVIVRTAGLGQTKAELQRDLRYLLRLWQSIQRASAETEFPGLVYREADLVIRTIRDHFTPDIGEVLIDNKDTYDRALAFMRDVMPTKAKALQHYTGDRPLFNRFNLEEQIEKIYKRRVTLPSGGEIVIDGTEALTAVDVNSARAKKGDAEETALQTNLEAAAEIARQLRLRDLGGLVVIDFIDMAARRNQKEVEKAMRDAMRGDKARCDVTSLSKLGLMEIARQRLRGAKMGDMYTACPSCEGYGLVKNVESAAVAALRKLQTRTARPDFGRIRVGVPQEVATWILNHKREDLSQIERRHNLVVDIVPMRHLMRHEVEFETLHRERVEPPAARTFGGRVVAEPPSAQEFEQVEDKAPPAVEAEGSGTAAVPAPSRRRRRRRRRGGSAAAPALAAPGEAEEAPTNDEQTDAIASPADATEAPTDDAEAPADATDQAAVEAGAEPTPGDEPAEGGRKRRRRRRRRSRGAEGPASTPASTPAESAQPEPPRGGPVESGDDAPMVPRGVRSDELMPAAVAGASRRSGPRGRRRG